MIDIRECIKPAIAQSGMKQIAVAQRAGLTQQQLTDIISKRRRLEANEFISICDAIQTSPNDVLACAIFENHISST